MVTLLLFLLEHYITVKLIKIGFIGLLVLPQ